MFGLPQSRFDCAINLSETGARIRLPSELTPPNEVWLIDVSSGVASCATVSCQSLPEVGLKFTERHELRHPKPGPLLHLRSLWLESAGR